MATHGKTHAFQQFRPDNPTTVNGHYRLQPLKERVNEKIISTATPDDGGGRPSTIPECHRLVARLNLKPSDVKPLPAVDCNKRARSKYHGSHLLIRFAPSFLTFVCSTVHPQLYPSIEQIFMVRECCVFLVLDPIKSPYSPLSLPS